MVVGEFSITVDVVVIGAGPAGLAAAQRCRALGREVAIIDPAADRPDVRRAAAAGVEVIAGRAAFDGPRDLSVAGNVHVPRVRFRRVILACGDRRGIARALPVDERIVAAARWRGPSAPPPAGDASAIVAGDDLRAVRAVAAFRSAGWPVRWVLPGDAPLPHAPEVVRAFVRRAVAADADCSIETDRIVHGAEPGPDTVRVTLGPDDAADPRETRDAPILVLSPSPSTASALTAGDDPLHLSALGLDPSATTIEVDANWRTSNPRVLAAGAITDPGVGPSLARVQGLAAAETACGGDGAVDVACIPRSVHLGDAEAAWCGLADVAAAREAGLEADVSTVSLTGEGPATNDDPDAADAAPAATTDADVADAPRASDHTAILVVERGTGLVLGGVLVGRDASLLIGELVLAVEMGAVAEDLGAVARSEHPLSFAIGAAARRAPATHDAVAR